MLLQDHEQGHGVEHHIRGACIQYSIPYFQSPTVKKQMHEYTYLHPLLGLLKQSMFP
jgi:glutamate mutase epsilon subunit